MPNEFEFSGYSVPQKIAIEAEQSPFTNDKSHRLAFFATQAEFTSADHAIKTFWNELIRARITYIMMLAKSQMETQVVNFRRKGKKGQYAVEYLNLAQDNFGQPVDAFHFINLDEDQRSRVTSMTVGTYIGKSTRYTQLVFLLLEDEKSELTKEYFHFYNGRLSVVHQVAKPQVLFYTPERQEEKQFLWIQFGCTPNEAIPTLKIEGGFDEDEPEEYHWYQNFGGDLISSHNLRVVDGEAQLFNPQKQYASNPFYIPQAVTNIVHFIPATAA